MGSWRSVLHSGGRQAERHAREEELPRRRDDEERELRQLVASLRQAATISDVMASRYHAAQTRLDRFLKTAPARHRYVENTPVLRFDGGRSGNVVLRCDQFGFPGLIRPFDLELRHRDRVAILGANGTGKSHFLKYIAYRHTHEAAADFGDGPSPAFCVSVPVSNPDGSANSTTSRIGRRDSARDPYAPR